MDSFFNIENRKKYRKQLVAYLYDKIIETSYPPNISAFAIKAFHFMLPYMAYLIFIFSPIWLSTIVLVITILVWCLFYYLKGCFLSNLEYKLDSDNFVNIVDPYLVMFDYPVNNQTRYDATLYLVLAFFSVSFSILYIRLKMRHFIKN